MHKKKSHRYTANDWQRVWIKEFRQRSHTERPVGVIVVVT